jgi:hypothetical protein
MELLGYHLRIPLNLCSVTDVRDMGMLQRLQERLAWG